MSALVTRQRSSRALLQALFVTFLWSTSWVLIKIGLSDDLPPLTFAGMRYTLAAAVLCALLATSPARRAELAATSPAMRWRLVALGVVFYAVTQGAQFVGLDLLPAATLSLLLSFTPTVVTVAAIPVTGEGATHRQWLGMAIAVGGVALYLGPALGVTSGLGLVVGMVGLGANAGASLLGRVVNRDAALSPLVVTGPSMAVGGLLTLGVGVAADGLPTLSVGSWAIVAWLAVVNTAYAFTLWNRTLQSLTATESSAVNNTMLVQIAVLAWLVLGEDLTGGQWLALGLVSVGIGLVQRWRGGIPGRRSGSDHHRVRFGVMADLLLRPPRPDDETAVRAAHEAMATEGFTFALFLDEEATFADWVERMDRQARGEVVNPRHVRSDFLLAVLDGQLVGRSSIRYELNDFLRREGGHVGYGVLPAFRRRGYAGEILRQSLDRLWAAGVDRALVTCADSNVGSAAVIERAGGVLEDRVVAEDGVLMRRYWIPGP